MFQSQWKIFRFKYGEFYYSMQQNPSSEANRSSACQEIPRILQNLKVHYRIYKSLQPINFIKGKEIKYECHSYRHYLMSHLQLPWPN
jgi:hypothetical protein